MTATNLYELQQGLWDLVTMVQAEDETDEEIAGWHAEAMALLEGEFDEKIDSCTAMVRHLEAEAEFIKGEAKRMAQRAKFYANRAERLKLYMCSAILDRPKVKCKNKTKRQLVRDGEGAPSVKTVNVDHDHEVIKTKRFTVRIQQSQLSIDTALVKIYDAEEPFVHYEPVIESAKALAAIRENGEIPPGFEDAVKEGKWSLRIR